jgi:hypothetical protein
MAGCASRGQALLAARLLARAEPLGGTLGGRTGAS